MPGLGTFSVSDMVGNVVTDNDDTIVLEIEGFSSTPDVDNIGWKTVFRSSPRGQALVARGIMTGDEFVQLSQKAIV